MRKMMILLLAVAGFLFGLGRLFHLRFEAGDNYPEYSSLRADPLGSKALFESLQALLPTERRFRSLTRLDDGRNATLLYLGVPHESFELGPAEFKAVETFVRSGGRLLVSCFASYQPAGLGRFPPPGRRMRASWPPTNSPPAAPPGPVPAPPVPPVSLDPSEAQRPVTAAERWGWKFEHAVLERDTNGVYRPAAAFRRGNVPGPPELAMHTALFFDRLDPAWRVLYARRSPTNDLPVLMERGLGRGTIVLAADSYLLSNEAMRRDRQSELLAWLIGPSRRVEFDETHLGTVQEPGIAALARQYRLGGFFLATLGLAGLFVWKNAVTFLPPEEGTAEEGQPGLIAGRDSAAGFINLLRRSIPPADVMTVCLKEWKAHGTLMRPASPARLQAMQQLIDAENNLDPRRRNPVRMYQEFCRILAGATPVSPPSSPSSTPS